VLLRDKLVGLGVPVVAGAPFGHGSRNRAFVLGARAIVADGTVRFGSSGLAF
jgi:muramoyltetrapeptide carboxypeptidase LdcA involved in peptidoglycan recycling